MEKDGLRYVYKGKDHVTAEKKIKQFYRDTIIFLVASAVVLFFITNCSGGNEIAKSSDTSSNARAVDAIDSPSADTTPLRPVFGTGANSKQE